MKLFTDITELKESVGSGNLSNELSTLQPYVDNAVVSYAVPIGGQELLEHLVVKIDDDTLDEDEKACVDLLRRGIGNLAYLMMSMDGGVQVDDSGFHRVDDGNSKQAYQWQMNDFRKARQQAGWNALREFFLFLEKNVNLAWISDTYVVSDERVEMLDYFVSTDLVFNRYITISGFQTWWSMKGHMRAVQNDVVRDMITVDVYDDLKALIYNQLEEDEAELIELVRRVVASGAIWHAVPLLPFSIEKGGLIISEFLSNKDNSTHEAQAVNKIQQVRNYAKDMFAKAKRELEHYMDKHADDYPSYKDEKLTPKIEQEKTMEDIDKRNVERGIFRA